MSHDTIGPPSVSDGDAQPLTQARGADRIHVLFALDREAAPFRRAAHGLDHISIHISGVGRQRAHLAAERVLDRSLTPSLVIAAGFCGALVPRLRVGDVVTERTLTVDHLVSDPVEKRRLAELHQAEAVDMESAAVAEVCAERGVRFLSVRAVSDTVDTALSPVLVRLLSGGSVSPWNVCRALIGRPSLLVEFLRLARDTKRAARNLAAELLNLVSREPQASVESPRSPAARG